MFLPFLKGPTTHNRHQHFSQQQWLQRGTGAARFPPGALAAPRPGPCARCDRSLGQDTQTEIPRVTSERAPTRSRGVLQLRGCLVPGPPAPRALNPRTPSPSTPTPSIPAPRAPAVPAPALPPVPIPVLKGPLAAAGTGRPAVSWSLFWGAAPHLWRELSPSLILGNNVAS